MPEKATIEKARNDRRHGKAPSTQAGEFVREEIHHVREGKHGARNAKQAIAIGLSKARKAGVKLAAPPKDKAKAKGAKAASHKTAKPRAQSSHRPSKARSRAATQALKKEGRAAASPKALSRQAKRAATVRKARGAK